jgi:hypothetical protein
VVGQRRKKVVLRFKAALDNADARPSRTAVPVSVRRTCLPFGIGKAAAQHGLAADAPAGAIKIGRFLPHAFLI